MNAKGAYEKLIAENCQMPVNPNILLALDEYKIAGGYPSPYIHFIYPRVINGSIMVGMTVIEICIYIAFFHFVYQKNLGPSCSLGQLAFIM